MSLSDDDIRWIKQAGTLGPSPSPRAQELIREATALLISDPEGLFTAVDKAVLATQAPAISTDPELTEAIRTSNHSNLAHWATANLAQPGERVSPNLSAETLGLARLIARRGIEDTSRVAYGAGQNAAWTVWMRAVFSVTSDAGELREVLDASSRSIFDFVERMLTVLRSEIERERGQVLSSDNARRLALIKRILEGSDAVELTEELRYLPGLYRHTAMVLHLRNASEQLLEVVRHVAEAIGPRLRRRPLTVVADADTVWAWFPAGSLDGSLSDVLAAAVGPLPREDARVTIGSSRDGIAGFRASHADALAAAQVVHHGVATYDAVVLAALVSGEPSRVREFIAKQIAGLSVELRETLRAYLANRCSPTRTAAATYTHRNTVIDRIRRAETILRQPIEGHELELAVALELDRFHWRVPVPHH